MDRKLVNSNKRHKGTIRSGAEKLGTKRGGHDVGFALLSFTSTESKPGTQKS
jgi:hypothetical protein